MSIMLIRPPFEPTGFDQQFQEPLNLGYLAAVLRREGFDVRLVDAEFCGLDTPAILNEVATEQPALVGVSLMSARNAGAALDLVEGIREWAAPAAHITAGGHFATFHADYLLRMAPGLDCIVLFEGEAVIADLARRVLSGTPWPETPGLALRDGRGPSARICRTDRAKPIADLDTLPYPARDLLPRAIQQGLSPVVLSSRGCCGACSFCTIHTFMQQAGGRPWRGRSPRNVVDEIQNLVDHFHIGEVGFLDDDFIGTKTEGRRRAAAIADLLLERRLDIIYNIECRPDMVERELFARLKESGLRSVFIGIEGVTPAAIQAFHKGINRDLADRALQILRDLDLDADVGFILYYPDATLEEVWEGYEFLKRHGQCDVHTALNRLFVVPGAPILEQLRQEGRLREVGSDAALGVYEYDYADRRVGVLLAILRVAVLPLFTTWYNALKAFRRLRADRKFRADAEAAGARLDQIRAFTASIDRVVERCFEEAYGRTSGQAEPDGDLLQWARRLQGDARTAMQAAARATSSTEFLAATG